MGGTVPPKVGQCDGVISAKHCRAIAWQCHPPPSTDPGERTFLLLSTRTPAVTEFTGPGGGKTARYMLRWLSTRGEAGPWSETASAAIGG